VYITTQVATVLVRTISKASSDPVTNVLLLARQLVATSSLLVVLDRLVASKISTKQYSVVVYDMDSRLRLFRLS